MNMDLCYIDLKCYPDSIYIHVPITNWAQVIMDLFLIELRHLIVTPNSF